MDFSELKKQVQGVNFGEIRVDAENCFEAVTTNEDMGTLTALMEKFLGPPAFPSAAPLSSAMQTTIKNYGGISDGQTLYYLSQGNSAVFAMFWPWGDKTHVTLKLVQQRGGGYDKNKR